MVVGVAFALGLGPVRDHLQAVGVLLRLEAPERQSSLWGLRDWDTSAVSESEITFDAPSGPARARLYEPAKNRAPGLVMVHGVHHLGMDEPRLMRFARSIASTGVVVMTPDVRELADYAVDDASIGTLGAAAIALRDRLQGRAPVGLMGLSFAGGLALLAASDPRFAPSIGYVVSVGGHDDLARVSRFFATGRI